MVPLLASLIVLGAALSIYAAVSTWRGRMREDPPGSGSYTIPRTSRLDLALGIVGAVVALAGGLLGLTL